MGCDEPISSCATTQVRHLGCPPVEVPVVPLPIPCSAWGAWADLMETIHLGGSPPHQNLSFTAIWGESCSFVCSYDNDVQFLSKLPGNLWSGATSEASLQFVCDTIATSSSPCLQVVVSGPSGRRTGNFSGPRNISVWWFSNLNTCCMRWVVSLKRLKWLSKFWLLINFSVCVAEREKGGGKPGPGSC